MTVRLLVVGLGRQGRRHCLVAGRTSGVEVVATVDPLAEGYEAVPNFADIDRALEIGIDLAVVATPTPLHTDSARQLLEAGVPTLVEKPLALTPGDAADLVAVAARSGTPLAVGHVERFNPAVQLVKAMLVKGRLGQPIAFSFRRVGLPPKVTTGTDVIHDLAVHDIDILTHLAGRSSLAGVSRWPGSGTTESAFLLLEAGDVTASLQVNWRTPVRVRDFTITTDTCYVQVNYTTQVIEVFEATDPTDFQDFAEFQSHYGGSSRTRFEPRTAEPMAEQMAALVALAQGDDPGPLATGVDGMWAVDVAHAASTLSVPPRPVR